MHTFIRWRSPSVRVFDQTDELTDILPGEDYLVNFTVPIDFDLTDLGVRPLEAVTIVSGPAAGGQPPKGGATGVAVTRFSQKTQRFPVVLDGVRGNKDGGVIYSNPFDPADSRSCIALTPGRPKPKCGASDPDNSACCPGLRCALTRSGHNKCFVNAVAGIRLPEGTPCTGHNQCEHRCDKSQWVCGGATRSRRAIEADAAHADDVEAVTGNNPVFSLAAGVIGGFLLVVGAWVGRRRIATVSGGAARSDDSSDSMTGLAETSLSPVRRITLSRDDKTPSKVLLGVL